MLHVQGEDVTLKFHCPISGCVWLTFLEDLLAGGLLDLEVGVALRFGVRHVGDEA